MTLGKFLAAARSIVGPPMSMFSRASSRVTPGLRDGLDEGVEVDDDEVDRRDALSLQLRHVLRQVAAGEDAAVDDGMERLDAAVEDLGEAGELGDGLDGDAGVGEGLVGAAGGVELDAEGGEAAGEVGEACLVVDADDSLHRNPSR